MSSSDDILDSWEEIDEAGLTNQLNQIRKEKDMNQLPVTMPSQNGIPLMLMMRSNDEYGTSYMEPTKPAVKILRRPQSKSDLKMNDNRPKQPIKTLQQREQEYAEARLRILGSAKNPEDEAETLNSKIITKSSEIPNSLFQISCNPDVDEDDNDNNDNGTPFPTSSTMFLPSDNNILRMPKGPDGTSGFKIRR